MEARKLRTGARRGIARLWTSPARPSRGDLTQRYDLTPSRALADEMQRAGKPEVMVVGEACYTFL